MKRKKHKKGSLLIGMGILMILAALLLTGYNLWQEQKAGKASGQIIEQIRMLESSNISEEDADKERLETGPGEIPLYEQYPDMEMPVVVIDEDMYVGILRIPVLGLELPVMDEWSYDRLQTAPCRYTGSVYKDDLIIAAHNYNSHFGNLSKMAVGDIVEFADVDGHLFTYQMVEMERIQGTAADDMLSGEWDLTLFTCNYDGSERVTIRCVKIDA